jgi:hypothetical protein
MNAVDQPTSGRGPTIVLVLFALFVLLFTKAQPASWSDTSRMGSIQAIVEHGTLALDDTAYLHQGDRVRIGGPLSEGGHFYSHQPPALAILAAAPYGVLHALGRSIDDEGTYKIITMCVVGLPLLLGLICLRRLMGLAGASERDTTYLLVAAAFGTLTLPYALVLNQHGTAAGLVMMGLLQVQQRRNGWAGLLLGMAGVVDLTALFFGLALLLPIYRSGALLGIVRYGAGALPPLALYLGINYWIAGDIKPLGLNVEGFEYPRSPFLLMKLTGDVDVNDPISQGEYIIGALFGASGLFSHHPVLLLAVIAGLWGIFDSLRGRGQQELQADCGPRGLTLSLDHAILLGSIGICLYYLIASRNFGGSAFGMRWFSVFAPSLLLLPAVWLGKSSGRHVRAAIFVPLLVWSVGAATLGAIQPWAKFTYRWQDTERGKAALLRGETLSLLDHWSRQGAGLLSLDHQFDEARYERDFLRLLDQHRRAHLHRRPDQTDEEHHASMEAGLVKLDRVVTLLDEEAVEEGSRAWAHYWRAQFYKRLGNLEAAERDIAIALELDPDFYRDDFFEQRRRSLRQSAPRL